MRAGRTREPLPPLRDPSYTSMAEGPKIYPVSGWEDSLAAGYPGRVGPVTPAKCSKGPLLAGWRLPYHATVMTPANGSCRPSLLLHA